MFHKIYNFISKTRDEDACLRTATTYFEQAIDASNNSDVGMEFREDLPPAYVFEKIKYAHEEKEGIHDGNQLLDESDSFQDHSD